MKYNKLVYWYERSLWYKSIAKSEVDKVLDLLKDVLIVVTALKVYGISFGMPIIIISSLILLILFVICGKILVEKANIVKINQQLGNTQNPELVQILGAVNNIHKEIVK